MTHQPAPLTEARSYTDLQTLHEISATILESLDPSIMMDRILEKTLERGKFDIGMIRLLDPAGRSLEPVSSRGYREPANIERQRKRAGDPSSRRVIEQVFSRKETHVDDLTRARGMRTFKREGVHIMVTVPLRTQNDVLGVIHLGTRSPRPIEAAEIRLLEAIGAQAGIAIQKIRLFEAAERRAKEQEILNQIAAATSQSLELNELFEIAATKIVEATGRRRINLRLKDTASGKVSVVTHRGFSGEEIETLRRMSVHPMTEQVFDSGQPLVIKRKGATAPALLPQTQSVAWIPIKASSQVVGVIGISDDQSRPFGQAEVDLLQAIGHVIGVAIENARLFGETRRQAHELEKANRMQADFVAMIAHDLRSPLMNISGAAEVMLKGVFGPLSDEQARWLGKIVANGHNLISLVSDFLDVSKLEAGCVILTKEMLDLGGVIDKCLENFAIPAHQKEISVTRTVPATLPAVHADRRRIDQVVLNLLSNAFKFTAQGGNIEVGVEQENGGFVRLWVKDDGIGIPACEVSEVFEKYRQASNAEACGHRGTGLGLVICKMVIEAHGGRISVDSEEGRGSIFSVSLPVETADKKQMKDEN
jgi:signal transduction histidine kinase